MRARTLQRTPPRCLAASAHAEAVLRAKKVKLVATGGGDAASAAADAGAATATTPTTITLDDLKAVLPALLLDFA